MIDLDELGARARESEYGPRLSQAEIERRALGRARRRLARRTVAIVAVAAAMVGGTLATRRGDHATPVATTPTEPPTLGPGTIVWPDESRSYRDPEALAQGFAEQFLGAGWTFDANPADGTALIVFHGPADRSLAAEAEPLGAGSGWVFDDGFGGLLLLDDGTVTIDGPPNAAVSSVEILHRPVDADHTRTATATTTDGPWLVPGVTAATDVGTVMVIARDTSGAVVTIAAGAVDGLGTSVDLGGLGEPASDPETQQFSADNGNVTLDVARSVTVDEQTRAVVGASSDGRFVCLELVQPDVGARGVVLRRDLAVPPPRPRAPALCGAERACDRRPPRPGRRRPGRVDRPPGGRRPARAPRPGPSAPAAAHPRDTPLDRRHPTPLRCTEVGR